MPQMDEIETKQSFMRFEVSTAVAATVTVFWDMILCNLADI
jgi:hypothetical protein